MVIGRRARRLFVATEGMIAGCFRIVLCAVCQMAIVDQMQGILRQLHPARKEQDGQEEG